MSVIATAAILLQNLSLLLGIGFPWPADANNVVLWSQSKEEDPNVTLSVFVTPSNAFGHLHITLCNNKHNMKQREHDSVMPLCDLFCFYNCESRILSLLFSKP